MKVENSVNVDEDIQQAIDKAISWIVERDSDKITDMVKNRTRLNYSSEIIKLKLKEYRDKICSKTK